jgi:hypothetical protein
VLRFGILASKGWCGRLAPKESWVGDRSLCCDSLGVWTACRGLQVGQRAANDRC